jgi:hypothetical protein
MGHKGPAWRPGCIWPGKAWTQILFHYAGQFLDTLKTVIISGLAYWNKDGDAYLVDKLPPFLEPSSASSTSPSTSRGGETTDSFADVVSFGKEAQRAVSATVHACDMKLFLVVYVSGFIAKRLLNGSSCDTCRKVWYLKFHHHMISTQDSWSAAVEYSWYCCDFWRMWCQRWLRVSWLVCHRRCKKGRWLWLD